MKYKNLESLINSSRSTREYFYTLPSDVQLELSLRGGFIHSSDELHALARNAEKQRREELLHFVK